MPTKEQLYTFVKSAKKAKCNHKGVCGAISSMSKDQLVQIAYSLGFDPQRNRFVYNKNYDTSGSESKTEPTSTSRPRRQQRQEEKKEEIPFTENSAKKLKKEIEALLNKINNIAERTGRDTGREINLLKKEKKKKQDLYYDIIEYLGKERKKQKQKQKEQEEKKKK